MDTRLWQIDGKRLTKLRRMDLPLLAQAIVDAEQGLVNVHLGRTRQVSFVQLQRGKRYNVFVRGDDWDRLMPFFRNTSNSFKFVGLPVTPPDPILSPQPNRVMAPIRESPSGGRSFMDRFDYDTQRQLTDLLTTTAITTMDGPQLPSKVLNNFTDGTPINPSVPPQAGTGTPTATQLDMRTEQFFRKILNLLLILFPEEFPTTAL